MQKLPSTHNYALLESYIIIFASHLSAAFFLSLFPFYSRSVIYADGGGGEKGFFGTRCMRAIVVGGKKGTRFGTRCNTVLRQNSVRDCEPTGRKVWIPSKMHLLRASVICADGGGGEKIGPKCLFQLCVFVHSAWIYAG
jgi:hypothetical protein